MFNDNAAACGGQTRHARPEARSVTESRQWLDLPIFYTRQAEAGENAGICFELPEPAIISIAVHNHLGQRLRLLVATAMATGGHRVEWEGRDDRGQLLPPGEYCLKVEAESESGNLYCASLVVPWRE